TAPDSSTLEYAYHNYNTTTTNVLGQKKIERKNSLGELTYVRDCIDEACINDYADLYYTYDAESNLEKIDLIAPNKSPITTTLMHDYFGRKVSMNDPNKGSWQ